MEFTISRGFSDAERPRIAALYWEAFSAKLSCVMGPQDKALYFLERQVDPDYALVARDAGGAVQGLAGFKTAQGALVGGAMSDLVATYGWLSALWRAPLLSLVERDLSDGVLLMDGICVGVDARGCGLGTALLQAIKDEARARGKTAVRLDVIDTNPRARALYEREGFDAIGTETLGPLRPVFGFRSSTRMLFRLT